MIIACPECAGPFDIPAEHIAELIQIECPHCRFRMILDFAAANDPSLIEDGMRMASGFRSAADYRRFAQAPAAEPPRPSPAPRHLEPVPAKPTPEPAPAPTAPAEPRPAAAVAMSPAARAARTSAPRVPGRAVAPPSDEAPHPSVVAAREAAARTGGTVVGPAPVPPPGHTPEVEPAVELHEVETADAEVEVPAAEVEVPAARTPRAAPTSPPAKPKTAEPEARRTDDVGVEADQEAEAPAAKANDRIPPHTPPAPSAPTLGADGGAEDAVPAVAETSGAELDIYEKQLHGSRFGTLVLVLLLLIAGGLVGASVALEGTPDPRPLLEDLYRQAFAK